MAVADKYSSVEILLQNNLSSLIDCSKAIVTHGKFGSYAFDEQEKVQKIPALTTKVLDSIGAGDSFLSISSPFAYLNLPLNEVALFGNIAGAIKLAKQIGPGKTVVTVLCDHGKRYASKIFNKDFLKSKNLPIPKWL